MMRVLVLFFLSCSSAFVLTVKDASQTFKVNIMLEGQGVIWGFDFISSNEVLFSERGGAVKYVDLKTKSVKTVSGVPKVKVGGQGGLLDLVLDNEFEKNKFVYLSYSYQNEAGKNTTRISRLRYDDGEFKDLKVLFTAVPAFSTTHHYGSRIVVDPAGYLFFSVGDRGRRQLSQDLKTDNGKVHRIKKDGSIPRDNPFVSQKGARPSIWTYGHRNQQGLTRHPKTGAIWEQEHGPRGGDEINRLEKGKNYGWPVITHGREYSGREINDGKTKKEGMEQPLFYWTPSIAPSGLDFYYHDRFKAWRGSLFSGALVLSHINRLDTSGEKIEEKSRILDDWGERIRNVRVSPDGYLYFSTDSGKLGRLE